jgi:hypothetical protein
MRFIDALCPPAMLYLIFLVVQVALDVSMGHLMTAGVKTVLGGAFVFILDALCGIDLGIVSWFIVAVPFVITALATAVALGLDADRRVTAKVKESFTPKDKGTPTEDAPSMNSRPTMKPSASSKKEKFTIQPESLSSPSGKLVDISEAVDYPFSSNAPF